MTKPRKEEISLTYVLRHYSGFIKRMVGQYLSIFWELNNDEILQEAYDAVKDHIFAENDKLKLYEEGYPFERFLNEIFIYDGFFIRFLIYKRYYGYIQKQVQIKIKHYPELDNDDNFEDALQEVIAYLYVNKNKLHEYSGPNTFATFLYYKIQTGFNNFLVSKGYRKKKVANPEYSETDDRKYDEKIPKWMWVKEINTVHLSNNIDETTPYNYDTVAARRLQFYQLAESYEKQLEGDEKLGFHTKVERIEGITKLKDKEYVIRFKHIYGNWGSKEEEVSKENLARLAQVRHRTWKGFEQYIKDNWEDIDILDYPEIHDEDELDEEVE